MHTSLFEGAVGALSNENTGTAFREVRGANLYPSISLKKAGEHVRVNFGQSPFVFDIDNMLVVCKRAGRGRTVG